MSTTTNPVVRSNHASGHQVRSVVANDEPGHHHARALSDLSSALPLQEAFEEQASELARVVTTPDFHPGKPGPVGVVADVRGAVLPHLIGNDIGCGMRMLVLEGVTEEDLRPGLEGHLRHVFFQGGRDVALTGRDRRAVLREGVPGLLESLADNRIGLLARCDMNALWKDVDRMSGDGFFATSLIDPDFDDYGAPDGIHRRDAILGTIGGGNHFVEFGIADTIVDGAFAAAVGIRKEAVVIVVHSGSLDFGQRVGTSTREKLAAGRKSVQDYRILSRCRTPALYDRYMNGHANAANVAFVNRLLIGMAAVEALGRTLGREVSSRLVYDAPHNTVWESEGSVRHRKGACPAAGAGSLRGSPYEWTGEPVILPGSMGDGTWLLRGLGSSEALSSSAHGAGRKLSRQEARAVVTVSEGLRVVGPVDLADPKIRARPDILGEVSARLKEEAPAAYRPIDLVVDPMVEAGIVTRGIRIRPVLTVKG